MNTSHLALRANSGGALPIGGFALLKSRGCRSSFLWKQIGFHLRKLILTGVCFLSSNHAGCTPTLDLAWYANPEPDIAGYELRYGESPGLYTSTINVGNN